MNRSTKRYRVYMWRLRNIVNLYRAWRWRRKIRRIYKDRTTSPLSEILDMKAPVADQQFVWETTECGQSVTEGTIPFASESLEEALDLVAKVVINDTIFCELLRGLDLGMTDEEVEEARNYDNETYERYWFRNRKEK